MQDPQETTILVVDDLFQNRLLAGEQLRAAGYRVVEAEDGVQALEVFQKEQPDLILLDIMMPRMNGMEACKRLREMDGGEDVPIVFLTALDGMEAQTEALDSGGDDFLTKPFRRVELLMRVRSLLRIRKMSREVRENAAVITEQRDQLVRARRQREELMALLVHDMKNLMQVAMGNADLITMLAEDQPGVVRAAEKVVDVVGAMRRMSMNLLDISRSELGELRPEPEPILLVELLGAIDEEFETEAARKQVRLGHQVTPSSLILHADEALIRRLIENLVHNALKFSPTGGRIGIEADSDGAGWVKLSVRDEGPGVPEAHRAHVLEKYVQLDDPDAEQQRGGRGLGLAFCRLATEAHGGEISVGANTPQGALFQVRLPAAASTGGEGA